MILSSAPKLCLLVDSIKLVRYIDQKPNNQATYKTTWLSFEVSIIAGNVHRALKFCMCFYHLFDVSRCFKFVMYPCSWVVQPPGVG